MSDWANASGHYYRLDGTPFYTIVGKNGKERPTTLRDARKLGLVPSVTGIIRLLSAPGLEQWKANELLMAALTAPPCVGPESAWIAEIKKTAGERAAQAAELGTKIHAGVERAIRDCYYEDSTVEYVVPAIKAIEDAFGRREWFVERSFATPLGYGGKLDLHCDDLILDIKSKDFEPGHKELHYDEHCMQLAAYRQGLMPRNPSEIKCGNVFVSRTHPGLVHVHVWDEDEIQRGTAMFNHCLALWKLKHRIQ